MLDKHYTYISASLTYVAFAIADLLINIVVAEDFVNYGIG